jgi:filamentous hemagglutinin family protein
MPDGVRSHRLGLPLLTALLAATPVQAQIVTDGTVGPKVSLHGGEIEIGANLATRRGDNLFHSFEKFGIATGQTATFTGPGTIRNVISRVTGGEASKIDGTLASKVGQADLYFLNPAGVMFGPNAKLDVPGSFHVSTAHELHFADGTRFSALDKTGSGLTVAPPEAFGFLDRPPGRIAVDQSQLQLASGKELSLVGGDLVIDGGETGWIGAEDGKVNLMSAAGPGTMRIADAATAVSQQGDIRVSQHLAKGGSNLAVIDVSGPSGGGTIRIRSGRLTLNGVQVFADNYGNRASTGGVDLQADRLIMRGGKITSDTIGRGKAGRVAVTAREMDLHDGGQIHSDTYGPGDAGQVIIKADRLLVAGAKEAGYASGIFSSAHRGATGRAGSLAVTARELELRDGGQIDSSTWGSGDAGQVTVNTDRLLILRNDAAGNLSLISSSAAPNSSSRAGSVVVTARELELRDGGQIFTGTWGSGDAGQVTVNTDRLLVLGSDKTGQYPSVISSATQPGATGRAGSVVVTARELELRDGGQIVSSAFGPGDAGQVTVNADRLLVAGAKEVGYASLIASSTQPGTTGRAGSVVVTARELLELRDGGQIASSTFGSGDAGQVTIKAGRLHAAGDLSLIESTAAEGSTGAAGQVTVTTRELELHDGSQIASSTFGSGDAGQVTVTADHLLVTGTDMAGYSSGIFSSTNPGSTGAGGAVTIQARSILLKYRGVISTQSDGTGPGGPLTITATDTLRLDNAAIQTRTETANGGDIVLAAGRLFDLHDSNVTTSVAGGKGGGGNIRINPYLMVLGNSRIQANAKRGVGGKITIQAGQLIRTPDSVIQASSELGLSGTITIAAPNTDVAGSLVVLPETLFDVSSELRVACATRGGRPASSFNAGGRGGLPPDPSTPLTASPFGQPLEQQTTTGSSTPSSRRPQAAKPITVSGIPQPVLGSPRLACRG